MYKRQFNIKPAYRPFIIFSESVKIYDRVCSSRGLSSGEASGLLHGVSLEENISQDSSAFTKTSPTIKAKQ